jgi:hypothetical protein
VGVVAWCVQSCEGIVTHFPSLVPPVNRSLHLLDKSQGGDARWQKSITALAVEGSECDEGATQEATMIVTPPLTDMMGAEGGDPDQACAQYFSSTQSNGDNHHWSAARFTVQEFPCQQEAVAQAVTASVGPGRQVMTGVRTQSGGCMATQASDGELVWTEVDCAQGLPTMCRMNNPSTEQGAELYADTAAAAGVDGGATQALFLLACGAFMVMVGAASYRSRRRNMQATQDEKLKLIAPQGGHRTYSSTQQAGVHVYEDVLSCDGYAEV